MKLAIGDRVSIRLPEGQGRYGQALYVEVAGTIEAFDLPGARPGVRIKLDRTVNGVDTCYATRDEVKRP